MVHFFLHDNPPKYKTFLLGLVFDRFFKSFVKLFLSSEFLKHINVLPSESFFFAPAIQNISV